MTELDRTVYTLPMSEIFCDNDFNCRGRISPFDVVDLARDILKNGLDFPIVVQPFKHVKFRYRIVAGHRRFTAFRVNNASEIPCTIRTDLDEFGAAALNLRENILRKELNILHEANGLRRFLAAGWGEGALADYIKQSRGWVQVRYILLRLPQDIQECAAAGIITQDQIKKMASMSKDKMYAFLRMIKEAKIKGEKIEIKEEKPRDPLKAYKRPQDRVIIFSLIEHILMVIGASLTTRALAWAAGEISDYEIHQDIKKYCEANDQYYEIPQEVLVAFKDKTQLVSQ